MNLTRIKEQLLADGEKIGLQVQEETKDKLTLHASVAATAYFKASVYMNVVIYEAGTMHVFFTFNEIERTYDNLYLINAFNAENPWFRAYIANINDKDYLELHYVAIALDNEERIIDTVAYLLRDLLKDDVLNYLKPIINNGK